MKKLMEGWNKFIGKTALLTETSFNRFKRMVDKERQPFLVISAYRKGGNNQTADKALKADIKAAAYPFTRVHGSGQEEEIDPETGEKIVKNVLEVTHIITTHSRGDVEREKFGYAEEIKRLFELGKSLAGRYNQYAFIFGYPIEIKEPDGRTQKKFFIAAYANDAPSYGEDHRIKEDWAGPWTTIERATADAIYWTKIAGTKGLFVENKIKRLREIKIKHRLHGAWREQQIRKWKSLL